MPILYCRHHDLGYCEKHGPYPCFSRDCKLKEEPRCKICAICYGIISPPANFKSLDSAELGQRFLDASETTTFPDDPRSADYVEEKNRKFAEIYGAKPPEPVQPPPSSSQDKEGGTPK
jgi:hypothetical protein